MKPSTSGKRDELVVWVTNVSRYHASRDCSVITTNTTRTPTPVPLSEIGVRMPCRRCFPKFKGTLRQVCDRCHPFNLRPCKHNGGVQVLVKRRTKGDTRVWTWPDRALFADVIGYGL